jgi:phospholipid/cholesterol/gamma-HCH transport system substrate-binding protein
VKSQLVVIEPTALVALDTQRIITPQATAEGGSENPQWSDSIPKLVQAKIVESFENSNYVGAVARPLEGLNADYQLALDLRSFEVSNPPQAAGDPLPSPTARVAFAAKILGGDGRIVASRTIEAAVPAPETKASGAAAALDQAFGKAAADLVTWVANNLN